MFIKNLFQKVSSTLLLLFFLGAVGVLAQSLEFNVTTNGSDRIVAPNQQTSNCTFPIFLRSSSGATRNESDAFSVIDEGNSSVFTFNHPVDRNRKEIVFRRTVNGCEAIFSVIELQQPVSQFSLEVIPRVGGVETSSLTVWEHISLGPLPVEPEEPNVSDAEAENIDDEPTEINVPIFCSSVNLESSFGRIGVLSEEIRIQENRLRDLDKQSEERSERAWQIATSLVEARSTLSRLENELNNWRARLVYLDDEIIKTQTRLDDAKLSYSNLQAEYVDEVNVQSIEGDKPLDNVKSGISISLDGGQSWIILVGNKGMRHFINEIRKDKDKGRQLHRRGQEVKRINADLYNLKKQKETADQAINNIQSSIINTNQLISDADIGLNESIIKRDEIYNEVNIASQKISELQASLEEENLLLDGCDNFQRPTSFWNNVMTRISNLFKPLALAYVGE